ncbi:GNAT family N-acetyltransferase [Halobacteriovorax sp. GB3]|uniref:GNAT family N-acetyltransferase n=1 Tax=Halobacteriovorax sp. GB3 TaxID=2719615 RepID=UPI00235E96C1|nr:GNAT family N-acetyltransferase [Halobacteriovorax sp. GB3]MDD0852704.1 GNAT family N-acetyltransferase [Halobacteriovorax sp. GB3]
MTSFSNEVDIRRFSKDDYRTHLKEVVELDECFFERPWKLENWETFCSSREFYIYCLYDESKIMGFSLFEIINEGEAVHLHKILLHPVMRGLGKGYRLFEHARNDLAAMGHCGCYLEVATDNKGAIALYEKCGLEVVRRVARFYGNGDDAFIMMNYS